MNYKDLFHILKKPEMLIAKIRILFWSWRYTGISRRSIILAPLKVTPQYLNISDGVIINKGCRIEGISKYEGIRYTPQLILGKNVSIQQNSHITCANKIEIGSNTAIAANVTITDIDHPYNDINTPPENQKLVVKSVRIGEDCKIYNNAVILQGITIGKHCVIGANSVVNINIPDYSVAVGIPAKVIKRYNFYSQKWEKTYPNGSFI